MVLSLIRKLIGTKNDRELKRMGRTVVAINALEPRFQAMVEKTLNRPAYVRRPGRQPAFRSGENV